MNPVFIAVIEYPGTAFVKELGAYVNLVGKIDAVRRGDRILVASTTGVGVWLDVGGEQKRLINGDLIDRGYKAFASEADAQDWIRTQTQQAATVAV